MTTMKSPQVTRQVPPTIGMERISSAQGFPPPHQPMRWNRMNETIVSGKA